MLLDIRPDYLQIVQDILQKHVPQYEVWAFGSRAKWTAKEYSDLDLCIVSDKPLSFSVLGAMGEDFSESDLPWKVDIVDWATTSPSFRKIIERDKVILKPRENPSEWSVKPLGEVINLKRGYDLPAQSRSSGNVPVISSSGITDFHSVAKAKAPGVVTGRYGTIGQVFFSDTDYWPLNTTLYVEDFKGNNPRFVYYLLKTISYQTYSDKAAVPGVNRNHLHTASVTIPDLCTQDEIAEALTSFDDKIALLRETNATLEAIAQALFKSWFVNFDPVRTKAEGRESEGIPPEISALFPSEFEDSVLGEIPKGWSVVSVGDVADVVKGKSYKSSELVESDTALVTLKSFTRGGGFRTDGFKGFSGSYKQEQVVKPGDCIVAYTDVTQQAEVIGRAAMVLPSSEHTTLVASLDVGIVRPKIEHLTTAFLYFLLRGERYVSHIFGYTSGTTVLHLAKEGLPTYQFILPPASLLQKFEEVAIPMMEQMAGNYLQTIELASLRDRLLPRLMSGKIKLSVNNQLESAMI